MQMSDLRPAGQLIKNSGCKCLVYGGVGLGKTPLIDTAPNPILLSVEDGLKSMGSSKTPTWQVKQDIAKITEFFKWFSESADAKKFDTLGIDSISHIAEISLAYWMAKTKDGRKAYGEMANQVMGWLNQVYYRENLHLYVIAKLTKNEVRTEMKLVDGVMVSTPVLQSYPAFQGQRLGTEIPHLFDEILFMEKGVIEGYGEQKYFRTNETEQWLGRDRTGKLAVIEPIHLGNLFNKLMM